MQESPQTEISMRPVAAQRLILAFERDWTWAVGEHAPRMNG